MATIEKRFQDASALLEKEEFLGKLNTVESDEECQKLFAEYGVELSIEDIQLMVKESAKASNEKGELSADELENVSGGSVTGCFLLGTAMVSFFTSYGYRAFKKYR